MRIRSKLNKLPINLRGLLIYLILWSVPIVLFWLIFKNAANPMVFFLLFYFGWYPILACIVSYKLASKNCWGMWKWLSPVLFGVLNGNIWHITYGITNILSITNITSPGIEYIIINTVASAIGLVIGIIAREKTEEKSK